MLAAKVVKHSFYLDPDIKRYFIQLLSDVKGSNTRLDGFLHSVLWPAEKSLFSPQAFVQNPQKTIFVKVVIYYPKLEMKIPLSRYFKI